MHELAKKMTPLISRFFWGYVDHIDPSTGDKEISIPIIFPKIEEYAPHARTRL
jgi:hypothetical protein